MAIHGMYMEKAKLKSGMKCKKKALNNSFRKQKSG